MALWRVQGDWLRVTLGMPRRAGSWDRWGKRRRRSMCEHMCVCLIHKCACVWCETVTPFSYH